MNQSGRVTASQGNQKIVFLTQRPQTPNTQQPIQSQGQNPQQNTVVKFVSNANTSNQQKIVTTQQKLVVVCMPNTNSTTTVSTPGILNSPSGTPTQTILNPGANQGGQPQIAMVQKQNFIQHVQPKKDGDDIQNLG